MGLEIKILESVKIVDTFEEAVEFIMVEFKKWYESDSLEDFSLTVSRRRGPPSLSINLGDDTTTGEAIG